MSRCKWCGKEFIKNHNRQMYCSPDCSKYAVMEQKAIYSRKYRRMYVQNEGLGSSSLGCKRNSDFELELTLIHKEKHRLKLY